MTKDPICGMTVDEATALRAKRDGETFYFCSEHCRKKFLAGAQPANLAESSCCDGKAESASVHGDCCGGREHQEHGNQKPGGEEHSCCHDKLGADSHSHAYHDDSHHGHEHAAVTPSAAA